MRAQSCLFVRFPAREWLPLQVTDRPQMLLLRAPRRRRLALGANFAYFVITTDPISATTSLRWLLHGLRMGRMYLLTSF